MCLCAGIVGAVGGPWLCSPSPPGLTLDEPVGVKESEEGSKEERVGLAATPSTGWPHPR